MKINKLLLIIMLAALLVIVAGCGWVENLKLFKGNDEGAGGAENPETSATLEQGLDVEEPAQSEQEAENTGLSVLPGADAALSGDTHQIVLYFSNADGSELVPEARAIPKQEGIARATVNQLIAGPASSDLYPTLPAATILDDINISNGLCTVDFSSELLDNLGGDRQSQMLAVYSIVNTLTQFDSVEYVQILVDGKVINTSLGGVDISEALAPVSSF